MIGTGVAETMIERIAETIGDEVFREIGSPSDWCPPEGAMEAVARAVLGVMREGIPNLLDSRPVGWNAAVTQNYWNAMIDAAVSEG